jgi:uncharacterized membrane protein (UPF0127 family)
MKPTSALLLTVAVAAVLLATSGCDGDDVVGGTLRNDLAKMQTARMTIEGQEFEVWLAVTPRERALGLKGVTTDELAPTPDGAIRGMLFVFDSEAIRTFTMLDTLVALDIAFMRTGGEIVTIHTMQPGDLAYSSNEPARYALEVVAGTFDSLGITVGDRAVLPDGV